MNLKGGQKPRRFAILIIMVNFMETSAVLFVLVREFPAHERAFRLKMGTATNDVSVSKCQDYNGNCFRFLFVLKLGQK